MQRPDVLQALVYEKPKDIRHRKGGSRRKCKEEKGPEPLRLVASSNPQNGREGPNSGLGRSSPLFMHGLCASGLRRIGLALG